MNSLPFSAGTFQQKDDWKRLYNLLTIFENFWKFSDIFGNRYKRNNFVLCQNKAQPSFFNPLRGAWIPDETLFQVFDIAF